MFKLLNWYAVADSSHLTLVWDWNSYIVYRCLTGWIFFLMKRALHFATKLNSRDIQKCNCFWVPSYDLFASARKAVFPAPKATGVHRLGNTWSSLWEKNLPQKGQQSFLNQSLVAPIPQSKIPGSAPAEHTNDTPKQALIRLRPDESRYFSSRCFLHESAYLCSHETNESANRNRIVSKPLFRVV